MEAENNNLGNFLRKKLTDSKSLEEDWTRPDQSVRAAVLEQITLPKNTEPSKPPLSYKRFFGIAAVCLLLLSCGIYAWNLQGKVKHLELALNTQNVEVENAKKAIVDLEEKIIKNKKELILEKEVLQNQSQIVAEEKAIIAASIISLEEVIKAVENKEKQAAKSIVELRTENQQLQDQIEESILISKAQEKSLKEMESRLGNKEIEEERWTAIDELKAISLTKWESIVENKREIKKPVLVPKRPEIKNTQCFEIGTEYSLMNLQMPFKSEFDKQTVISKGLIRNSDAFLHSFGLFAAYSPKQNWWIRTGLRFANQSISKTAYLDLKYDKSGEYLEEGQVINEFHFTTETPYSEAKNSFALVLPEDRAINEGEVLKGKISDYLELKYLQIPLGVDYIHEVGNLQWLIQGGLQWNQTFITSYDSKTQLYYQTEEIRIDDRGKEEPKETFSKQFLSAYAGLGLNYSFAQNWQARTIYNYQFSNLKSAQFEQPINRGYALKLGLHYRF